MDKKIKPQVKKEVLLPKGLTRYEEKMIKEIIGLSKTPLSRIMIPKVDMIVCSVECKIKELAALFHESGHSRLPVFCDSIDNIVGIAHLKDIFRITSLYLPESIEELSAVEFVRLPNFIYENINCLDAFLQLQRQKISLAIVIDEFGRVVGLVTIRDLLEEIVGEIADEFAREKKEQWVKMAEGRYLLDPKIGIEKLSEILMIEPPALNVSTLAGLIYHIADRIPKVGEKIEFGDWEFTILEGTARKITKVIVGKKA